MSSCSIASLQGAVLRWLCAGSAASRPPRPRAAAVRAVRRRGDAGLPGLHRHRPPPKGRLPAEKPAHQRRAGDRCGGGQRRGQRACTVPAAPASFFWPPLTAYTHQAGCLGVHTAHIYHYVDDVQWLQYGHPQGEESAAAPARPCPLLCATRGGGHAASPPPACLQIPSGRPWSAPLAGGTSVWHRSGGRARRHSC